MVTTDMGPNGNCSNVTVYDADSGPTNQTEIEVCTYLPGETPVQFQTLARGIRGMHGICTTSNDTLVIWDGMALFGNGDRFPTPVSSAGFKSVSHVGFAQSMLSQCRMSELRSPCHHVACQICGIMSDLRGVMSDVAQCHFTDRRTQP